MVGLQQYNARLRGFKFPDKEATMKAEKLNRDDMSQVFGGNTPTAPATSPVVLNGNPVPMVKDSSVT